MKKPHPNKKTHKQFKKEVERLVGSDYILLTEYDGAFEKVGIKHIVCGHEYEVTPSNFLFRNSRCPKCAMAGTSRMEQEVYEYIKTITDEEVINGYKVGRKEIDIYIPERQIGFEFNGLYWHSNRHKEKNYHKKKILEMQREGYHIISIYEDDWIYNKENIKEYIYKRLIPKESSISLGPVYERITKKEYNEYMKLFPFKKFINHGGHFYRVLNSLDKTLAIFTMRVDKKNKLFEIRNLNVLEEWDKLDLIFRRLTYQPFRMKYRVNFYLDIQDQIHPSFKTDQFLLKKKHDPDYMYVKGNRRVDINEEGQELYKIYNAGYLEYQTI